MNKMFSILLCGTAVMLTTGTASAAAVSAKVVDFNAVPNVQHSVTISWTTTPQVSAEVFTIMRSADGHSFTSWRTLQGPGQTSQMLEYLEVDQEPMNKVTFYRLMQVSANGDTLMSEIRVVRSANLNKQPELAVLPYTVRPAEDENTVETKNSNEVLLVLQDSNGGVMFAKAIVLLKNDEVSSVVLRELPGKGKYMIAASSREGLEGHILLLE